MNLHLATNISQFAQLSIAATMFLTSALFVSSSVLSFATTKLFIKSSSYTSSESEPTTMRTSPYFPAAISFATLSTKGVLSPIIAFFVGISFALNALVFSSAPL